ncbi:MAG: M18 family aminopeptidase [Methylococcus sp.]|jgi:aspartyl aminopeptidase|nr:MAG: M18 family aminopeptidase [Methylococcus sp.]
MRISQEHRQHAEDLIEFIDQSPSPWHAVETLASRLRKEGFTALDEKDRWTLTEGQKAYVIRGGSSLIAFHIGTKAPADVGFRIIGAHTDSPGLRIKPQTMDPHDHWVRLGVEVYGSPILATYGDRDLSLAGRVTLQEGSQLTHRLIRFEKSLLRLPNLAIHLNRQVNEEGLKFHLQTELPLLLGTSSDHPEGFFLTLLSEALNVPTAQLRSFELAVYDTHAGGFWGADEAFIAHRQIDNLASCHASLLALLEHSNQRQSVVCAFFDHEEVGSQSYQGADGSFLSDVLERLYLRAASQHPEDFRRSLARSLLVSADGAHGFHPNFPAAFEPHHPVRINQGPALKMNVNQRYATNGDGEALFRQLLERANIPGQIYVHRSNLGCGSTIGPLSASRLGIPTLDCGVPMWAMHSIRESAGVLDQLWLKKLLSAFLSDL